MSALSRYNQYTSASVSGSAAIGASSSEAMAAMEEISDAALPEGYGYAWSGQSYQETLAGASTALIFGLALIFAYLFLTAQYESFTIPTSVILSVAIAAIGAIAGLSLRSITNSIYAQIGLVLLVGLSSKSSILIVEFSKSEREAGKSVFDAAVSGARQRFRAVLMTGFSFILGVLPLLVATGAGANSRQSLGTVVFAGALADATIGVVLVPPLYYIAQTLRERLKGFPSARSA